MTKIKKYVAKYHLDQPFKLSKVDYFAILGYINGELIIDSIEHYFFEEVFEETIEEETSTNGWDGQDVNDIKSRYTC